MLFFYEVTENIAANLLISKKPPTPHALTLRQIPRAGTGAGLLHLPDYRYPILSRSHHLNKDSSIAKASFPQSPHDVKAIPLKKSALFRDMICLQFGHLYCPVEFISATRHNPGYPHPLWKRLFPACVLYLYHFCILYPGQSKPLLSCCFI